MAYVRKTVSGAELNNFIHLPLSLRNRRVEVIVLPAENAVPEKQTGKVCRIGCCPNLPELPDSFFEPLPEEDLKAWGL
ncbi:MAG: hypothetical protein FWH05_03145 [Oscillospiraceae bacterium]|nr:hypothetical protein [Oscillospiraceae bacterium]